MDLNDIEEWGRELLQSEARKRGVKNPEVHSRAELVRMILKHDYGAPTNVREAARLIGGIWGSAKNVVRARLRGSAGGAGVRTYVGAARDAEAWRDGEAERGRFDAPYAERTGPGFDARDASAERGRFDAPYAERTGPGFDARDASAEREVKSGRAEAEAPATTREDEQVRYAAGDADHGAVRGRPDDERAALREAAQVRLESRDARRDSERVRADTRAYGAVPAEERVRPEPGWHDVPLASATGAQESEDSGSSDSEVGRREPQLSAASSAASRGSDQTSRSSGDSGIRRASEALRPRSDEAESAHASETQTPHLRLVEPPADALAEAAGSSRAGMVDPEPQRSMPSVPEVPIASAEAPATVEQLTGSTPIAASEPEAKQQHLTYGPHPHDGMLVRWRVTADAIERARKVLGTDGELAVRIVVVRVNLHAVVKTDVIDHGPVAAAGEWTAPLFPTEARYVSAIGLRSPMRFVSIVHAAS